jgi:poly-beta-1,6-N-acetyl-D-glucosamine synthase
MLSHILLLLLGAFLFYYLMFLWDIWKGLSSLNSASSDQRPFASVIIPTRNEEKNIVRCLRALIDQSYNRNNYEIIIVDDHSQDNTVSLATKSIESITEPKIRVLQSTFGMGKAAALSQGVTAASGELILCTDADSIVPVEWIKSMVSRFMPSVAFVAGPVFERSSGSNISRLQAFEYLSLTITAAGLIGSKKGIICSGANIAYRKSAFVTVNGYGDGNAECDDETLMQRMVLRKVGSVAFNSDPFSAVLTETPSTFSEFWQQRTRWASKKGRYEDPSILRRLIVLYIFFALFFVCGSAAFIDPFLRLPCITILVAKALAEYCVLSKGSRLFRQHLPPGDFVIAELFHVPYIAFAGLIGQFNSLRWKDRNIGR